MSDRQTLQSAKNHSVLGRRGFVKGVGGVIAGGALGWGSGCHVGALTSVGSAEHPNLLFVYADQMREMAMSCSGGVNRRDFAVLAGYWLEETD